MTSAVGRVALKYTQGTQVVYVDVPNSELRARIQLLLDAGVNPNTIFAFVGGELDISQVLQVTLNGVIVP